MVTDLRLGYVEAAPPASGELAATGSFVERRIFGLVHQLHHRRSLNDIPPGFDELLRNRELDHHHGHHHGPHGPHGPHHHRHGRHHFRHHLRAGREGSLGLEGEQGEQQHSHSDGGEDGPACHGPHSGPHHGWHLGRGSRRIWKGHCGRRRMLRSHGLHCIPGADGFRGRGTGHGQRDSNSLESLLELLREYGARLERLEGSAAIPSSPPTPPVEELGELHL